MKLAVYMDNRILKPRVDLILIEKHCREAIHHGVATICVSPYYTAATTNLVIDSDLHCCNVNDFTLGSCQRNIKMAKIAERLQQGLRDRFCKQFGGTDE